MNANDDSHLVKDNAVQNVFKVRRDYNTWVSNETLEDYALRFTPRSYRKWPEWQVANTAFSSASFLVLEAIGATLLVDYGFINTALAILVTGLIIFLVSMPLSRYSARHGLDMDLLTRGSGFGYLGSTITSLIYAAFTFIFFALEAAIMASALKLAFHIPVAWGYLICAIVVIPLVTRGITAISRLQTLTQPIWLVMLFLPYIFLLVNSPEDIAGLVGYSGHDGAGTGFDIRLFSAAVSVSMAIIAQMGEQADYLRFMPEPTLKNRRRWLIGVLIGGTGWLVLSAVKMLGGALLAYLAIRHGVSEDQAVNPTQMYLAVYHSYVFPDLGWAVAATATFVIISQLKINVTNAYAGSLAWSNFFSRLTHSHPGRVVWVVFNTLIALMLMELDLLQVMGRVLGLYSNVAVAWMMSVVADLVINKPLGLSPRGIEFRRAYLYDINPVGFGAMGIASALAISVYLGLFGQAAQPYAIFVSLGLPLILSPLFAWITRGQYYIARQPMPLNKAAGATAHTCCICGTDFEAEDMSHCPAYQGSICSLCCTLDARCQDLCKPQARLSEQWAGLLGRILPAVLKPYLEAGLGQYMLLMAGFISFLGMLIGLLYYQESLTVGGDTILLFRLHDVFMRIAAGLLLVCGVIAWWMVLANKSRQVAQEEANYQTQLLVQEIDSHHRTDQLLQQAKATADQANLAKSRYIMTISHELRTPLNSILGYAQILDGDEAIPANRRQAINVIRRSGDHLLSLIEGTLDIARIEGGKVNLDIKPLCFPDFVQQIVSMFELQARNKGIDFGYRITGDLPTLVRADARRLRQILINILGNAVKFTVRGGVICNLKYQSEMATFEIEDTGPGIAPEELGRVFEPFARGSAAHIGATGGTGLGLTIAKMLTDLMGGELTVESSPGRGCRFRIRLFLPHIQSVLTDQGDSRVQYIGYAGVRRRIMIVDNEKTDRDLLVSVLEPLGFHLVQVASGQECLDLIPSFCPHLIFMDLAMPGMDGWETILRIRQSGLTNCEIAIISANAFEKGKGNDVGISADNFITKPVNVHELLDWIGRHLGLEWVTVEASHTMDGISIASAQSQYPSSEHLRGLGEQIELGYVRGILVKLDEIEKIDWAHGEFVDKMRQLAHRFQFDTMKEILRKGLGGNNYGTP